MQGHLILYVRGKRVDKPVPQRNIRTAATKVKELKDKGVKAHLVYKTDRSLFPPPDEIDEMRGEGYLWCPYCRTWRWFTVPKFKPGAEVNSEEWFLNSFHRQDIKVCQWCRISVTDFYVCKANGIWGENNGRKRRRKRRAR